MWIDNFIMLCRVLIIYVKLYRKELRNFDLMFCDLFLECGVIIFEILEFLRIDLKLVGVMRFFKDVSVVLYIFDILLWNIDKMNFVEWVVNLLYYVLMFVIIMYNYVFCDGLWREFDV